MDSVPQQTEGQDFLFKFNKICDAKGWDHITNLNFVPMNVPATLCELSGPTHNAACQATRSPTALVHSVRRAPPHC